MVRITPFAMEMTGLEGPCIRAHRVHSFRAAPLAVGAIRGAFSWHLPRARFANRFKSSAGGIQFKIKRE